MGIGVNHRSGWPSTVCVSAIRISCERKLSEELRSLTDSSVSEYRDHIRGVVHLTPGFYRGTKSVVLPRCWVSPGSRNLVEKHKLWNRSELNKVRLHLKRNDKPQGEP